MFQGKLDDIVSKVHAFKCIFSLISLKGEMSLLQKTEQPEFATMWLNPSPKQWQSGSTASVFCELKSGLQRGETKAKRKKKQNLTKMSFVFGNQANPTPLQSGRVFFPSLVKRAAIFFTEERASNNDAVLLHCIILRFILSQKGGLAIVNSQSTYWSSVNVWAVVVVILIKWKKSKPLATLQL